MSIGMLACGSAHPPLATVEGAVTRDGKPLADARVVFTPVSGRASTGMTDDAGRYTLIYLRETQGAVLGPHEVTVNLVVAEGEAVQTSAYPDMPMKSVEVQPGSNVINLDF